jgi:hypothetical protein
MQRALIAMVALAVGMPNARLAAQTPESPQAPQTLRQALVGTWRLVAARQRLSDGSVRPDPQPGAHGVGYIMYDATGHMCVVLANPDRSAWKAPKSPTDAEVRSAFEGLVAYGGADETNAAKHYVIHHIEADREPALIGTARARLATVTATRLVLQRLDVPAGVAEWTVEFERVGGGMPASSDR